MILKLSMPRTKVDKVKLMLVDILYWITYPLRYAIGWALHYLRACDAWCAWCYTEAEKFWDEENT